MSCKGPSKLVPALPLFFVYISQTFPSESSSSHNPSVVGNPPTMILKVLKGKNLMNGVPKSHPLLVVVSPLGMKGMAVTPCPADIPITMF